MNNDKSSPARADSEPTECRQKLREHIDKGDPLDVAAYCAFLWHHGESTALAAPDGAASLTEPLRQNIENAVATLRRLGGSHAAECLEASARLAGVLPESPS